MRVQLVVLLPALLLPSVALAQETEVASDLLYYADSDHVIVATPQVAASHELDEDGGEISARVALDAITAASVDVISNATYRFSELRTEANFAVSKSFGDALPSLSYRYSDEPDYQSHGAMAGLAYELAGGDSTLFAGYGLTLDTIGRTDTPRSAFSQKLTSHSAELGITQVLDTKTLLRGVYTLTIQDGYMEKPYRSVPLFSEMSLLDAEADGVKLDIDSFDTYRLAYKPLEEVPDRRYRHAAAVRGLRFLDPIEASGRVDYRLYADSWGVVGHTLEAALVKALPFKLQLTGWTRLYYQSAANFWQRSYTVADNALPDLRTTDKSLSPYHQETVGLRIQWSPGSVQAYLQAAGMFTGFLDHLFISKRYAFISQTGVRWRF